MSFAGLLAMLLFTAAVAAPPAAAAGGAKRTIVFLGDSLTAGFGLEPEQAYPALIQRKIDAAGWPFTVVNAGLSGDTTTGGLHRLDWVLRADPGILVIALGANDGLRGIAPEVTEKNLQAIVDRARRGAPERRLLLVGMKMPPNLGVAYTARYERVFRTVADRNRLPFLPFLLAGVAGNPALNQADGMHPNAQGQRRVADTVWMALLPLLQAARRAP